jgi:hypothetical protein
MSDDSNLELAKELASAFSTQAQVANRMWLVLMTVSLFAVLPPVPKNGNLSLPFGLPEVNAKGFHTIVYFSLVILAIAFASAHAQQMRAQKLAIDLLPESPPIEKQIHPREFFNMLRTPSFNRIAPLAQLLRGKYQYYKTKRDCPTWLRRSTVVYYALLKLTSLAVYFWLPFWAMRDAYVNVLSVQSASFVVVWCARIGGCVAGSALVVVLIVEMATAREIAKHLWLPPKF